MRSLLALAFALFLSSSVFGQVDAKAMLASLKDIKVKQADSVKSQLVQTISDFTSACSDDSAALAFYTEAVRITQFVGRPHEDTAFFEWKKSQLGKLNPSAIRTALRYTTLSLQRSAGATDDQIFPPLLAYAQDTAAILPSLSPQGEMRRGVVSDGDIVHQPVSDNIFSRWYNLAPQLSGLDDWESVPANLDGIYGKILLPVMRKNRDPRILQYWDDKILAEKGRASTETAAFDTDRFNLTRRPSLLWSRAEDEIVIGMRDKGITEMYNLVKAFPAHPDAGKWIPELETLLTAAPAPATGGAAPAPSQPSAATAAAPPPPPAGATPTPGL